MSQSQPRRCPFSAGSQRSSATPGAMRLIKFPSVCFIPLPYAAAGLMGSLVPLTSHVRAFAEARPPGIYKHDYIDCLYEYFSEKRPSSVPTPPRPQWKDEDVSAQLWGCCDGVVWHTMAGQTTTLAARGTATGAAVQRPAIDAAKDSIPSILAASS